MENDSVFQVTPEMVYLQGASDEEVKDILTQVKENLDVNAHRIGFETSDQIDDGSFEVKVWRKESVFDARRYATNLLAGKALANLQN